MQQSELRDLLKLSIRTAVKAGKEILDVYKSDDFEVELKSDNSPLTKADRISNEVITEGLADASLNIPVLSEEGKSIPYETRKKWSLFWLVDPLDGTKEFIKRNGEFTVNIALIENNEPVMGVIYAPAYSQANENVNRQSASNSSKNEEENYSCEDGQFYISGLEEFPGAIYFAAVNEGAFKAIGNDVYKLGKEFIVLPGNKLTAVASRSHSSDEEKKKLEGLGVSEFISVGSSLKFCLVAEGKAQVYFRNGPTMEWDVGAGYAIAKEAGSKIEGLTFNKENLLNGSFSVVIK